MTPNVECIRCANGHDCGVPRAANCSNCLWNNRFRCSYRPPVWRAEQTGLHYRSVSFCCTERIRMVRSKGSAVVTRCNSVAGARFLTRLATAANNHGCGGGKRVGGQSTVDSTTSNSFFVADKRPAIAMGGHRSGKNFVARRTSGQQPVLGSLLMLPSSHTPRGRGG
jgi:hypothetical protein